MWHEARRREKATQKICNEHKKRAEKRREENRVDPSTLLQVHGVRSKIHIDSSTHKQAAKSLVVWHGDKKTTIDRFDVRATLDRLPDDSADDNRSGRSKNDKKPPRTNTAVDAKESESMRKLLNYERYRLLVQNDLNKVPEATRLKLVTKSEYLCEAKMKKLESNWFGTSGETGMYDPNSNRQNMGPNRHSQTPRSQGATISFNYNQVPPPQSLLPTPNNERLQAAKDDDNRSREVLDLDDFDKFDLDAVDKSRLGTKRTNEVTSRYGLSCDEFDLLTENAQSSLNLREILTGLQKLRDRLKDVKSSIEITSTTTNIKCAAPSDQTIYGPALPPDMLANDTSKSRIDTEDDRHSSTHSSPVRQRSPSGAKDLPMRASGIDEVDAGSRVADLSPPGNQSRLESPTREPISISLSRKLARSPANPEEEEEAPKPSQTCDKQHINHDHPALVSGKSSSPSELHKNGHSKSLSGGIQEGPTTNDKSNEDEPDSASRPRRASTPLAYKRYRRSSRSLSRDRDRHRAHRHRRRHRSSSSSGSATTSGSSSSSASLSNSNSSFSSSSSSSRSSLSPETKSSRTRKRTRRSRSRERRRRRSRTPDRKRQHRGRDDGHRKGGRDASTSSRSRRNRSRSRDETTSRVKRRG